MTERPRIASMTPVEPKPATAKRTKGASPVLFAPARPRRAIEEITSQILSLIAEGKLLPGDRLPAERTLAAQLEVSRNTLREALRMLEISGVVTLRKGGSGGSFVATPDERQANSLIGPLHLVDFSVADLTAAMGAITAMLVQAAMPSLAPADLAAMEANIAEAEHETGNPSRRSQLLIDFYRLLAEASGNKVLVALTGVLVQMLGDWVARIGSVSDDRVIRARRALLEHLRRGDVEAALKGTETYLGELHKYWLHGPPAPRSR